MNSGDLMRDPDWNSALAQIQRPLFRLGSYGDAVETLILELQSNWTVIMHWVIKKKLNSSYRMPGGRAFNKRFEPMGQLYYTILELCIQVHAYERCGYLSASDWFTRIITHDRMEAYKLILAVDSGKREAPTKTKLYDEWVETSACLQEFRYPHDPRVFKNPYRFEEDPHMHRLVAASVRYAEISRNFREKEWKMFVDAVSAWTRDFRGSEWSIHYVKDKKLYSTSGRGRNGGISMTPWTKQEISEYCKKRS